MRISSILLTVLLATAAPAMAQEPAPAGAQPAASAAEAAREADRKVDRHCLKETGTHIRARRGERRCSAFAGRVWTREDLDRTGHVNIADALRALDVSIR